MPDIRPFFGREVHENSGELYESAVLGEEPILDSPDLYHFWSSVTGNPPGNLLVEKLLASRQFRL